ncbi:hypothetical protein MKD33_01120, partial [Chromobacterium piscinae]
HDMVTVLPWG